MLESFLEYTFLFGLFQIEKSVELEGSVANISAELQAVKELHSRVYLLYAETPEAEKIFHQARLYGLFEMGHVWLITEQALSASNCPIGTSNLLDLRREINRGFGGYRNAFLERALRGPLRNYWHPPPWRFGHRMKQKTLLMAK